MINEILLRRRNKITLVSQLDNEKDNIDMVLIVMKNINDLGYTFSKEVIEFMRKLSEIEIKSYYNELVRLLKGYVGADKVYQPMYPNFPQQVELASDWELFVNAMVHYLSEGTLFPEYEKDERLPLFESPNLTILELGTKEDSSEVLNNLISSKTSLSETDKEDMKVLLLQNGIDKLPSTIPYKENIAIISQLIVDTLPRTNWYSVLKNYLKTATDILRFCVALSHGDVSLHKKCMFRSYRRAERDLILRLLNNCGSSLAEDMLRYRITWIRLGERLHPFEERYAKTYPNTYNAFNKIRNNSEKIDTFAGKLENAYERDNVDDVLALLSVRQGEFARNLDRALRYFPNDQFKIVSRFAQVADKVSVPVLLQVKEHFTHRNDKNDSRVFFPKGSMAKVYSILNELPELPALICGQIVDICQNSIMVQLEEKEFLGKVYIDDSIKGYCVPQSQRSASKALKTITRGSKFPVKENTNTIRGFIWWTNFDKQRVDIDLSMAILDKDFNYVTHVSYTRLRSISYKAYHSGDITSGGAENGKGASEFIDVDIDSVVKENGRYLLFQVNSFTGQPYSTMPNVMFGWMERKSCNSGEIYEPSTVEQRIDITAESTVVAPMLFDCVTREFVWMDIASNMNSYNRVGARLETNLRGISAMCYGIINGHKPSMYDLAKLNAKARGVIVKNRDEADTIFDLNTEKPIEILEKVIEVQNEQGEVIDTRTEKIEREKDCKIITPFMIDVWMTEML